MTTDQAARVVQMTYPQVYLACHTRHQRKRSTEHRLSSRDSAILAHLDVRDPVRPSDLAKHLQVSRSTVTEALQRLVALGFVQRARAGVASVVLTQRGSQAVADTSVLESDRLRRVLGTLSTAERDAVCHGLTLLAGACRRA